MNNLKIKQSSQSRDQRNALPLYNNCHKLIFHDCVDCITFFTKLMHCGGCTCLINEQIDMIELF